jgi:hypothetical protein
LTGLIPATAIRTEIMAIPYLALVVVCICAITFYRAGQLERSSGLIWAGLSFGISLFAMTVLKWGPPGILLGQGLLFVAITLLRMRR